MTRTVMALYDEFGTAQETVQDLVNNGFRRDDISLVAKDGDNKQVSGLHGEGVSTASEGAGVGAVLGGLAGLLVGLGALAIPGIGPIIAAGPLAATLAGAGVGAITGGLVGALMDAGVPQEEAQHYAEGVRRGGTLVIVRTADQQTAAARELLDRHGAVDIQTRVAGWRQEGWEAEPNDATYEAQEVMDQPPPSLVDTLPEAPYATSPTQIDEQIGPRSAEEPEDQPTLRANMTSVDAEPLAETAADEWGIEDERRAHSGPEEIALPEHDSLGHMGATEEQPNPALAPEGGEGYELGAGNEAYQVPPPGSQEAPPAPQPGWNTAREYDAPEDEFRKHYELAYAAPGGDYERHRPAYRYGYELSGENWSQGRKWSEVEPRARSEWERRYPNEPWDNFRDAVRQGWERAAGAGASARDSSGGSGPDAGRKGGTPGWAGPEGRKDRPSYQGPEDRRI